MALPLIALAALAAAGGYGLNKMMKRAGQVDYEPGTPEAEAARILAEVPQVGSSIYNPYIKEGEAAYGRTSPLYQSMSQDPTSFVNQLMEQYTPSEGYQAKQKEMMQAAQNAAAQGGYAGTPYAQQQQADLTKSLLSQDMQEFLGNVLGIQDRGLAGEEGAIGRGFQSSGSLADFLGSALTQQAELSYAGAANKERMLKEAAERKQRERAKRYGAITKYGTGMVSSYFGGSGQGSDFGVSNAGGDAGGGGGGGGGFSSMFGGGSGGGGGGGGGTNSNVGNGSGMTNTSYNQRWRY